MGREYSEAHYEVIIGNHISLFAIRESLRTHYEAIIGNVNSQSGAPKCSEQHEMAIWEFQVPMENS